MLLHATLFLNVVVTICDSPVVQASDLKQNQVIVQRKLEDAINAAVRAAGSTALTPADLLFIKAKVKADLHVELQSLGVVYQPGEFWMHQPRLLCLPAVLGAGIIDGLDSSEFCKPIVLWCAGQELYTSGAVRKCWDPNQLMCCQACFVKEKCKMSALDSLQSTSHLTCSCFKIQGDSSRQTSSLIISWYKVLNTKSLNERICCLGSEFIS